MAQSPSPVYVIVAAAGRGSRMDQAINKQFISVGNCPVIVRTVRALAACSRITGIIVMAAPDEVDQMRSCLSVIGTAAPQAENLMMPAMTRSMTSWLTKQRAPS